MSEPELSVPRHWSTSTGVRQIWILSQSLCVGGVGLCSILGLDEKSYWQPGSPSHWHVCLMVHTQPVVGLSDPVLTPRVECVTTCFCLCCGLLRVGWWGHDKGGVGVKEWDCVETANLRGCRRMRKHFQCFAIILIPHWFFVFIWEQHRNPTSFSTLWAKHTCKTTGIRLFQKVKCAKSGNGEHSLVTSSVSMCVSWFTWSFLSDMLRIHVKSRLVGWEYHCVLSIINQWGECRTAAIHRNRISGLFTQRAWCSHC